MVESHGREIVISNLNHKEKTKRNTRRRFSCRARRSYVRATQRSDPVVETVPFSHFAGSFTFEAIGAGACSVRARPVFRSFLGLTPCLSVWCFLLLRHLSAEAFGGRRTQVRKWRMHCLLDRLMSLAAVSYTHLTLPTKRIV